MTRPLATFLAVLPFIWIKRLEFVVTVPFLVLMFVAFAVSRTAWLFVSGLWIKKDNGIRSWSCHRFVFGHLSRCSLCRLRLDRCSLCLNSFATSGSGFANPRVYCPINTILKLCGAFIVLDLLVCRNFSRRFSLVQVHFKEYKSFYLNFLLIFFWNLGFLYSDFW